MVHSFQEDSDNVLQLLERCTKSLKFLFWMRRLLLLILLQKG